MGAPKNGSNVVAMSERKLTAQTGVFAKKEAEIATLNPRRRENAELAAEYDRQAKAWMEGWRKEVAPAKQAARATLNEVLALEARGLQAPASLRTACGKLIQQYNQVQREKAEAEARARELRAKEEAEAQRAAELAHMVAVGRPADEVEAERQRPLPPLASQVDPDAGKVAEITFIDVWLPECSNGSHEVVFRSQAHFTEFMRWVIDNPAFHHLVSVNYGPLKKLLTDNRGMLQPPGLVVLKTTEVRNRGKE